MKKFLLMLTLFCAMFSTAKATEVVVGDSTSTTYSTYVPFYTLYNYGYSQQIFTADEIGTAGTINSLSMWMYYTGSLSGINVSIYMAEVDSAAFNTTSSWIPLTEDDLVYSGTLSNLPTSATGLSATTFELTTPFSYSGSSNLLIAIANNTGSYSSGFNCRVDDAPAGANMSMYVYRDASAYNIAAPGVTGTRLAKRDVIMLDITPSGGQQGPTCDKPEAVDITDVTSTSAVVNITGGTAQNYQVEYKGANDAEWVKITTTQTAVQLTGLTPYTSYSVKVTTICGEDLQSTSAKGASFKTLIGVPYADGLGAQGDWTKATGLLDQVMAGTASLASGGSWYFGARSGQPNILGGPHAYMNLYGTSCKHWIISPMIPLPENGNYVLTYQVALTDYSNEDPIENPTSQQDDKLVVLVSTDSCHTWSILQQWDNAGSAYVYNEIPTTGEEVEIDLSAYAGQEIQIAFYGESTVSGGDNDIHVGHVLVDYAPSCMTPDSLVAVAANTTKTSAQLDWRAKSGETAWILEYKALGAENYTTLNITEKPYTLTGLQEFTEYNVRIAAKCSEAEDGTSKFCKPITIKTASGVPFVQSFDTTLLPSEWVRYEALLSDVINEGAELEATKNGWNVTAANSIFADADNHLVLNLTGAATKYWIAGPIIEMEANQQLSFNLAFTKAAGNKQAVESGKQNSQKFYVFISTNGGASWTDIAKWTNAGEGFSLDGINTEGTTAKIDLSAYAANSIRIAFYGESTEATDASNNLHIANVKIADIPACEKPTSLNITGIQGTVATAVWEADEDGTWEYGYVVKPAGEFVLADSLFMGTTTETTFAMTGLTETTHYMFFVRHICDNDTSEALIKEFATIQTPTDLPYEHNFETGNGWMLINGDLENHWVWSDGATADGSKALYISNDNFNTYAYSKGTGTAAMVYAAKTFYFDQKGMYSFQYDWKCWGYSSTDYLRVALIPADVELEAATTVLSGFTSSALPEGWKALDGGSKLNLDSAAWNHKLIELAIEEVGYYQMVFAWRNGTSTYGKNPPAAVDNVKVARILCPKPTHLTYAELSAESVTLSWDEVEGVSFEYALVAADSTGAFADPTEFTEVPNMENSIQFSDLTEKTSYKFFVRKACGGEDGISDAISITFKTLPLPLALPWSENFNGLASGIPEYWDNSDGTTTTDSYKWNRYVSNGDTCLRFNSYMNSTGNTNILATPRINLSENAILSFRWKNPTGGAGEVLISVDGGENKVSLKNDLASISAWATYEINLSDYTGQIVNIYFKGTSNYGNGDAYLYLDDVEVKALPSCMKPTDLAVIDSLTTTNSATITWTAGLNETNWLVQYKKSADTAWTFVPDSVLADTWVLTGLEASNVYDVRVAAWCDTNDSTADVSEYCAPISFITGCEVITTFPYTENFDGMEGATGVQTLPICWNFINTSTYSSNNYYPMVYKGATYANSGTNSLKFYSTAYYSSYDPQDIYAILPEMEGLDTLRIRFNARANSTSTSYSIYDATFMVGVMSNPDSVATFVAIDTIQPTTTTYAPYEVKFDTYTGAGKYIAIKMPAAIYDSIDYRGFYMDDIVVEPIPNCLEPTGLAVIDTTITMNSAVLTWTAQGNETEWILQYKKHADAEWTDVPALNDTLLLENLESATKYDVRVAAKCGEDNVSPYTAEVSFVTACGAYSIVNQGAYIEGFENYEGAAYNTNGVIPNCWEAVSTGTVAPHVIIPSDTYAYIHSGEKALTFYGSGYCYAVLPEFAEPLNTLQISFWAAMESATYGTLKLGYITNESSIFHEIATYDRTAAKTIAPYETVLTAVPDSAARLVFQWYYSGQWSCCIDDIKVSLIPNCLKPTDLEAVLTKANGSVATLNWKAGKEETAWAVEYSLNADFSDSIHVEVNDSTLAISGLMSDSTYYARVKAVCGEEEESEWSNPISFTPTNAIIVNDSTNTNSYVPFYGYYVHYDVKSQFVVPASEMNIIAWDSITQLTFYSSTATAALTGAEFDVYVAPYDTTVISSEMNWNNMTKVVSKKHLSISNKQMVVTFDKPYQYEGGNLLIGFKLATKASSSGTTASFYGKSGQTGASIGGYASTSTGTVTMTQRNFLPKMRIDYVHGEMPTCFVVKNIAVSDITASSAALTWTPGTEDQNAWQVVYSADPAFDLANVAAEDIHDVAALPYAIAELATDTLYKVYVRANCSDGENADYSQWSELFTFHTASACQTPNQVKADSITTTSALISWNTYGQTGFNLLYSDGTAIDTIYNVNCPYLLEGLTPSTSYRVKVQTACAAEADTWSQMASFKTAYGIPFSEKFNATSIPDDWKVYSGLMNKVLADSATLTETSGYWYYGTSNDVFDSHARRNIYGTSCYHWLATPNVALNANVQLSFDLALTAYSGTGAAATTGTDDKFAVLVSTNGGEDWTVLRLWDNAGSAYVYNNIATAGEEVVLDLSAYNGQSVMIAFYGESTVSNADNNLHIDNVLIDRVPTCIKPTGLNISEIKAHTAKVAWTAAEGQEAWQLVCATKATEKPDTMSILDVTDNPYVLTDLNPSTTYYVYVRANCGESDGNSKWTDGKSFKTTVACPAPKNLVAELTPGVSTVATLKWTAGGDEAAWRVEYSTNANMSDSIVVVVEDTIYELTGLTAETTYYARVLADCGQLDSLSAYSAVVSFTPTAAYLKTLNEGTATNANVPVWGYNADNATQRSQFIIPETALEDLEWDSIKAFTFYSSSASVSWGNAQFEVYLAEAPEATLAAEADWEAMTQVMAAGSLSVVDSKMVVTLDAAYQYQGGHLLVGIKQTVKGTYKSLNWYGVTAKGASLSGVGTNMNQQNFLPKLTIEYAPGVAPACPNPKNLQVVSVAADSAVFSWKAVAGASWEYAVALASAEEPTTFNAVPEGANTVVVNGLDELTSYVFYLRRACGEDGNSESLSVPFETLEIAEVISYDYNEDFEHATGWKLINGTETNAWMIGSATNYGGEKALYISNDGAAYDYDDEAASVTYATKLFNFVQPGTYTVSYDYKCVGEFNDEDGALDYMRVALLPADVAITAGELLNMAQAQPLDSAAALVAQSAWTRMSAIASIPTVGLYRLAFIWINDDADSDGVPAAIDNISITLKDYPLGFGGSDQDAVKAIKFIRNNHVYILVNGILYDATGRRVE